MSRIARYQAHDAPPHIIKRPAPNKHAPPQAKWKRLRTALPSKANWGLLMMLFTRTNEMEIQERRHPR
jgi:hypothetical protein